MLINRTVPYPADPPSPVRARAHTPPLKPSRANRPVAHFHKHLVHETCP